MNPFIYGEKVTATNFCNRKEEIAELISEITNSQNMLIFSPRRYGKSSLIEEVFRKLDTKNIIYVYIDLFPVVSNEDFVRISLKSISEVLRKGFKDILAGVKKFFKRISPSLSVTFSDDGTPSIGINFTKAETLPVIEDIFNGFYEYIKSKKVKALVVFDEFQQVGELEDDKIEKILRSVIQNHRDISYVFMGSKKHLLYKMFNNPERPFYKSCAHFPLHKIKVKDFSSFIGRKFKNSRIKISTKMCEQIVELADSHPYYTQFLAHVVYQLGVDKKQVNNKIIEKSVEKILDRESAAFMNLWDNLTLKQKRLLVALALKTKEDKIFSSDFLTKFKLGSAGTVQRGIAVLIEKGIIDKEKDTIEINDTFLKLWLKKRMSFSILQNL